MAVKITGKPNFFHKLFSYSGSKMWNSTHKRIHPADQLIMYKSDILRYSFIILCKYIHHIILIFIQFLWFNYFMFIAYTCCRMYLFLLLWTIMNIGLVAKCVIHTKRNYDYLYLIIKCPSILH